MLVAFQVVIRSRDFAEPADLPPLPHRHFLSLSLSLSLSEGESGDLSISDTLRKLKSACVFGEDEARETTRWTTIYLLRRERPF
jgi:hypothetical protein